MVYSTSAKGVNLIKRFEGLRLEAYKCPAGKWTIGYGHTNSHFARSGKKITAEEAEDLLRADLVTYERHVNRLAGQAGLWQYQFDALVSFCFNVGVGNFRRSTLLQKLNAANYAGAAAEFDRWVNAKGVRLTGLVRRRAAERAMFEGREA